MRAAARLSTRLAYWLRMAVAAGACLRHVFRLLRQGDGNIRILMRCEEAIRGKRLRRTTKYARLIASPLQHYFAILKTLPKIAGVNAKEYRKRLDDAHKLVQNLAVELPQGRSFLSTRKARRLQRQLLPVVFQEFFSIPISPQQATSFAIYAESSEVIRDFLTFCRHNDLFESKEELLLALPVFEELVRPYRFPNVEDKNYGPEPEEFCMKILPSRARIRPLDKWFRPSQAMARNYWSSLEIKKIMIGTGFPPWACKWLEQHFAGCAALRSHTLLGVLAFEMHQRACFALVQTAIQFRTKSRRRPHASPDVTGLLDQCLAELEESVQQANGRESKKPLAPSLVRVR